METKQARISQDKRRECLYLFQKGVGYKKTASLLGLSSSATREYLRRYKAGDISWSERGPVEQA